MIRPLAILAALLAFATGPAAQSDTVHTFQVVNGLVMLDGRALPDAIPEGMDLTGLMTNALEFSGPVAPVLEVDGRAYVLEDERLVPLAESSRGGRGVYVVADGASVADMPKERVMPIVEQAYMRDVASSHSELYDRMQQEAAMEAEVRQLAARVQRQADGPERRSSETRLRGLLSDLLTLKHEIRAREIEIADERLDTARQGLAERIARHDEIVDGRLRELIGSR